MYELKSLKSGGCHQNICTVPLTWPSDNIAADNVATIVQEIIVIVNLTDGRACGAQLLNRFLCQPAAVPKWLYVTISDHS